MVAARRLRKSMLKEMPNIDIDNIGNVKSKKHKSIDILDDNLYIKDNLGTFEEKEKLNSKFKLKIIIKVFISAIIIFSCLCGKLFFKDSLKENKFFKILINEYNKDYTKIGCIEKCEDLVSLFYDKTKYIIPENLANKVEEKYILKVKPYLVEFEVKEAFNKLFITKNEIDNTNTEKDMSDLGVGGGGPLVGTMNTMDVPENNEEITDKVEKILSKNINIKKPVDGTITSKYGNREEIFKGVDPYHTGIDIANKIGTEIKSATSGIVRKIEENNKYYGNFIEIETDGVTFKYAHLQEINVKIDDEVNQETIIGLMGSTGMSTGPHLHFEIKIDGQTVDPNNIIKFY